MRAKHAVPAGTAFAVSAAAVPAALSGTVAPALPVQHAEVKAVLDSEITYQMPQPRPLVTRITSRSARKTYTIASGDTLSGIAGRFCRSVKKWPEIWNQNKAKIRNPDMIYPGTVLRYTCDAPTAAVTRAAMAAIPQPAVQADVVQAQVAPVSAAPVRQAAPVHPATPAHHDRFDGHRGACGDGDGDGMDAPCSVIFPHAAPAPARRATAEVTGVSGTIGTAGMGSMQACIIARESGGNSQVVNASGHYGLYQFSASTWSAHGGSAADFGHASVAEQNAVFAQTVRDDGYSDWAPYDGC